MNRIFKSVLSLLVVSMVMTAEAATITVDGITYTTSGTNAKVSKGPTTGEVVIPSTVESGGTTYTVTELSNNAFKGANITSVSVPGTVTKIGSSVFNGCKLLTSFTLEDSGATKANQTIGTSAFENCVALTTLNLPNSVKSISSYCFRGCSGLQSFVCPNGVTMLIIDIFANCTSLKSFTIGSAITSCDLYSIAAGCPIEEVFVAEGNKSFLAEDGVLYSRSTATGPKTGLQYYPVCRPGDSFTIPDDCPKLGNMAFNDARYLKSVVINDNITAIGNKSFCGCPVLENIVFGSKVKSIGSGCFADSPKLTTLVIPETNTNYSFADYTLFNKDKTLLYLYLKSANQTEYEIPKSVVEIGSNAFEGSSLKSVSLPEGLQTVGMKSFASCVSLTSVNIPQSVKTIDEYAFSGCKGLAEINLPDSLKTLGAGAFKKCVNLTEIVIPEKLTIIDESTFADTSLSNVVIPDAVKTVGDYAFETSTLEYVVIGAGVTEIGTEAFYNYYEESTAVFRFKPTTPPSLGLDAFNAGLTLLVPGESLEVYKKSEGYENYDIRAYVGPHTETVTLESAGTLKDKISQYDIDGVIGLNLSGDINGADFDYINKMSFLENLDLSGATIIAGKAEANDDESESGIVTVANTLPMNAFAKLNRLASITLPSNLVALADSCLASNNWDGDEILKKVVIPASVTSIGSYAFENRLALDSITLPAQLKKMGKNAFSGCESIKLIEIPGSMDTIPELAFTRCSSLKDLVINDGVKVIDDRAFMSCKSLTSVTLPNSVDSIAGAFQFCTNLKDVKLSEKLRTIGSYSFAWCANLEEITLPEGLEYIGASVFAGDSLLTHVNIPESVTELRNSVFSQCKKLQEVDIPRNVKRVGDNLCWSCTSLKRAVILYDLDPETGDKLIPETAPGNNRVHLGNGAFSNCGNLESVYIGNNVFFLNDKAFADTPNLKEIYVNNMTPPGMYEGDQVFTSYDATLYVPKDAINTYRTNRYWKYFTNIQPLEKEGSSVENFFKDADLNKVTVDNGVITIVATDVKSTIVDLSGRIIYSGNGGSVSVPAGLYLVTIGSETVKVWVK